MPINFMLALATIYFSTGYFHRYRDYMFFNSFFKRFIWAYGIESEFWQGLGWAGHRVSLILALSTEDLL